MANLVASTVIFAVILYGVTQRRRRRVHIPIMLCCLVADLLLVTAIELRLGAVETALESARAIVRFHVAVSVGAVLSWLFALASGLQRRRGRWRRAHFANACVFLVLRSLNWVTAFFVV